MKIRVTLTILFTVRVQTQPILLTPIFYTLPIKMEEFQNLIYNYNLENLLPIYIVT